MGQMIVLMGLMVIENYNHGMSLCFFGSDCLMTLHVGIILRKAMFFNDNLMGWIFMMQGNQWGFYNEAILSSVAVNHKSTLSCASAGAYLKRWSSLNLVEQRKIQTWPAWFYSCLNPLTQPMTPESRGRPGACQAVWTLPWTLLEITWTSEPLNP